MQRAPLAKISRADVEWAIAGLHEDPVRRGLCGLAVDWKWSSVRYDLLDPPRQQFAELPVLHGSPCGLLD